jgi:HSP20 family molecular chaperone IbpA
MSKNELIEGYPLYDNNEACVVYKFNLNEFNESEIHLKVTNEHILNIAALGENFLSFEREILLEPEVDTKLATKKIFQDGVLTVKIPKAKRPDGLG